MKAFRRTSDMVASFFVPVAGTFLIISLGLKYILGEKIDSLLLNSIQNIAALLTIGLVFIWSVGVSMGFSLRKRISWLYILSGLFVGLNLTLVNIGLETSAFVALLLAGLALILGPIGLLVRKFFLKTLGIKVDDGEN